MCIARKVLYNHVYFVCTHGKWWLHPGGVHCSNMPSAYCPGYCRTNQHGNYVTDPISSLCHWYLEITQKSLSFCTVPPKHNVVSTNCVNKTRLKRSVAAISFSSLYLSSRGWRLQWNGYYVLFSSKFLIVCNIATLHLGGTIPFICFGSVPLIISIVSEPILGFWYQSVPVICALRYRLIVTRTNCHHHNYHHKCYASKTWDITGWK